MALPPFRAAAVSRGETCWLQAPRPAGGNVPAPGAGASRAADGMAARRGGYRVPQAKAVDGTGRNITGNMGAGTCSCLLPPPLPRCYHATSERRWHAACTLFLPATGKAPYSPPCPPCASPFMPLCGAFGALALPSHAWFSLPRDKRRGRRYACGFAYAGGHAALRTCGACGRKQAARCQAARQDGQRRSAGGLPQRATTGMLSTPAAAEGRPSVCCFLAKQRLLRFKLPSSLRLTTSMNGWCGGGGGDKPSGRLSAFAAVRFAGTRAAAVALATGSSGSCGVGSGAGCGLF